VFGSHQANKIAEVCICYTSDVLTSDIYNLEYYKKVRAPTHTHTLDAPPMSLTPRLACPQVTRECVEAGAHIIGLKVRCYGPVRATDTHVHVWRCVVA
jgi:hypothetical protein